MSNIDERIKKQKNDLVFVIGSTKQDKIWDKGSILTLGEAKRTLVIAYEKYESSLRSLDDIEDFGTEVLSYITSVPEVESKKSHLIKIYMMLAYYYELINEKATGEIVDKEKFRYGKDVDVVRTVYHRKKCMELFDIDEEPIIELPIAHKSECN